MPTIENGRIFWLIGDNGVTQAFRSLTSGASLLENADPVAFCRILCAGREVLPLAVENRNDQLIVRFPDDLTVTIDVRRESDCLVLRIASVTHMRFDRLIFLDVPLLAGAGQADVFCACALALNLATRVDELPGPQRRLTAQCYPKFGVAGAAAAIIGCPFREMRRILMRVVNAAPDLPRSPLGGPWALDAPENKTSYMFGAANAETVDEYIALCHDFGMDQLHFAGTKALRYGDYAPHPESFPDGLNGVRTVVDRLHAAGLRAGLHTMSFSIAQDTAYVSPVPDRRLAKEGRYTLATPISNSATEIKLMEDTAGLPREIGYFLRRSMTLQIGDELIEYARVFDRPSAGVGGCRRGAWGTRAQGHAAGTAAYHLCSCWGLFAPDGETSLFSEIAGNISNVVNECGFDMIYLDGLDGIHILGGEEARWHYGAKFAFEVFQRLQRPVIMEMAAFLHHLWFLRSRLGAWDHPIRGYGAFLNHHLRSNAQCARIFLPAHLGWWVPRTAAAAGMAAVAENDPDKVDAYACKTETTFPEDAENLCIKALGADIGFSLQGLSPPMVGDIPHLRRLGEVFNRYARARGLRLSNALRRKLCAPDKEHALEEDAAHRIALRERKRLMYTVRGPDDASAAWEFDNPYGAQAVKLRIEALWSAAPYNDERGITLADFKAHGEFNCDLSAASILNSGKQYAYPGAAPGLRAYLTPVAERSPDASAAAVVRFRAESAGAGSFPGSSPDDDLSLLDHGERIYRERPASWVWLGKRFAPVKDLSSCPVYGLWVHSDGSGAVLNVQLVGAARRQSLEDHYVPLDYTGWRYQALIEPESERFEQYVWPYGRAVYDIYRSRLAMDQVAGINLWLNHVPVNGAATCLLSEIRALPLVKTVLHHPALAVAGREIILPFDLSAGDYTEITPAGQAVVFSPYGHVRGTMPLPGGPVKMRRGANRMRFKAGRGVGAGRARVAAMVRRV